MLACYLHTRFVWYSFPPGMRIADLPPLPLLQPESAAGPQTPAHQPGVLAYRDHVYSFSVRLWKLSVRRMVSRLVDAWPVMNVIVHHKKISDCSIRKGYLACNCVDMLTDVADDRLGCPLTTNNRNNNLNEIFGMYMNIRTGGNVDKTKSHTGSMCTVCSRQWVG